MPSRKRPRRSSRTATPAPVATTTPAALVPGARTRTIRVVLCAAAAGGATLVGEVLGARLLRPVVGSTAVALAGTVAGVLGGIGLGARLAGRAIDGENGRTKSSPERVLMGALLALVVLTLVAPPVAAAITTPSARVLVALGTDGHPRLADALRALVSIALTAPFGVLAGAGYPSLAALYGRGAGRATAVSGAASSLGAAVATVGAVFVLAPAFGVRACLLACAGLYAVALGLASTFRGQANDAAAEPVAPVARGAVADAPSPRTVALALALAGFGSIGWQLALARLGVLAFGPSAFALAAATAAHTLSLGTGEALCVAGADRARSPRGLYALIAALGAALAVGATVAAPHLPAWSAARLFAHGVPSMPSLWAQALGLLVLLTLPVIAAIGALIPLGARLLGSTGLSAPRANARALTASALGNVASALVTPLVLVPWLGLRGAMLACAALFALGALLVAGRARLRSAPVALAAVALVACGVLARRPWDDAAISSGPFLYARSDELDLGRLARLDWGREATVAVRQNDAGEWLLQVDGKVDATTGGDASTQLLVGLVPAVLSPHPRRVLVVGLGTGMTVDAIRAVPGVARVDVTELLPEVVAAARGPFRAANHHVLDDPRVRVLARDASLELRGSRAQYDVVVSEPSNPWVAGMSDLFTVEALSAARERLRPGGVAAAWLHAYSTDVATFRDVLATFRTVFPQAVLLELVPGQDYMLVGMVDPVGVDTDRLATVLTDPGVVGVLARAGVTERGAFFGRFVAGADGLVAMAREGEPLEAQDLRLEFRAPLVLYNDAASDVFALLGRAQDEPLAGLRPRGAVYPALLEESEPVRGAALHARQMAVFRAAQDTDGAIREGELAVADALGDGRLRDAVARLYIHRAGDRFRHRDPGGAEDDLHKALELDPEYGARFRARVILGDLEFARGDLRAAASDYGQALEIGTLTGAHTPEIHLRMVRVLLSLEDVPHAREEFARALRDCDDPARRAQIEAMIARLPAGE